MSTVYPLPPRVRRLASRALRKYEAPEFQAFWGPAKTLIREQDRAPLQAWAKNRVGVEPDFVIGVRMSLRDLGEHTPRETFVLVDERGTLLRGTYEADNLAVSTFDERAKTYPKLKRVKDSLSREDWVQEIKLAILVASAESEYGYPTSLGAVEWRIVRANPVRDMRGVPGEGSAEVKRLREEIKTARKRASANEPHTPAHVDAMRAMWRAEDTLEEVRALARYGVEAPEDSLGLPPRSVGIHGDEDPRQRFLRAEDTRVEWMVWRHYAYETNEAKLSPRERAVFRRPQMKNREIAEEIGVPEKQVDTYRRRAVRKVHEIVGAI